MGARRSRAERFKHGSAAEPRRKLGMTAPLRGRIGDRINPWRFIHAAEISIAAVDAIALRPGPRQASRAPAARRRRPSSGAVGLHDLPPHHHDYGSRHTSEDWKLVVERMV